MLENNNFSFFKLKLFIKNIESNLIFIWGFLCTKYFLIIF
jgi:hypothetical protein